MTMVLKRVSGRKATEMRPMIAKVGVVPNADGSAIFAFGNSIAIAAVYGPRQLHPQHMQDPSTGILRVTYDLLSFSVSDRKKPGPSRRSQEISKVIEWSLLQVLDLKEFPNTVVDVQVYIPQADASTRVAAINAASMALAHAGLPMKDLVTAVSVGKLDKDLVVDVDKDEEDFEGGEGPTDFPMAKIAQSEAFTLLQLDGKIPPGSVKKALAMGSDACNEVYEVQKKALKEFVEA